MQQRIHCYAPSRHLKKAKSLPLSQFSFPVFYHRSSAMSDFFPSHSENEDSEVEAIISQSKDLVVLEQISSINLSGVSDSVLPTDLEARFRTLKSFPATKSKLSSLNSQVEARVTTENPSDEAASDYEFDESEFKSATEGNKASPDRSRKVSKSLSSSSSSISSVSSFEASSPPKQTCCFWRSPRKVARKKSKENRVPRIGNNEVKDWGKNEEFLTDLSVFSEKEQKRRLKQVLKEQEKISREAEKIVQWAKQASARMNSISGIEEDSSDDDKNLKH